MMKTILLFSISFLLTQFVQGQQQLLLNPIKDNTLIETPDTNSNGMGPSFFAGKTGSSNSIRRGLLQFDIAGNLPAGAIIDSVTLQVYMDQAPNNNAQNFELHRLLTDWGEGNSSANGGMGAPAQIGDATWNFRYYNNQSWTIPGGDFDSLVESATAIGAPGFYTFPNTTNLSNLVQSWLTTPWSNHGFIILGNELAQSTTKRFASRENIDSLKPALHIWYHINNNVSTFVKQESSNILVFPNPSSHHINIHSPKEPIIDVEIYDLWGRIISKKSYKKIRQTDFNWSINDLSIGNYVIFIQTASHSITKQLTILH